MRDKVVLFFGSEEQVRAAPASSGILQSQGFFFH